ncbi:DUF1127 domain-containing protein [Aminobacter ciceronei]|jgi:uncharacterized protein YjiS (DUF1127 family)|uniref:DUF1127 domain-containing protein n=1 Tax=Aminobacter ciceronei TaxID=150723 RepID=UPI003F7046A1
MQRIYSRFGSFWNYLAGLKDDAVRLLQKSSSSRSKLQHQTEGGMNDICMDTSASPRARWAALPGTIANWRWRIRFRWELEQKLKSDSHLIEDIGLTAPQVEAEIAKHFWQA